ncbi:hypothetical protein TNCV_3114641 [Trichonephila clavipes]|nr:hypothetical protein TNCV_3114641 [Trichonephila clavipes]
MQPDLRMHICEHIIRVLQHQKDVNQKQHICVKHDFVLNLVERERILPQLKRFRQKQRISCLGFPKNLVPELLPAMTAPTAEVREC